MILGVCSFSVLYAKKMQKKHDPKTKSRFKRFPADSSNAISVKTNKNKLYSPRSYIFQIICWFYIESHASSSRRWKVFIVLSILNDIALCKRRLEFHNYHNCACLELRGIRGWVTNSFRFKTRTGQPARGVAPPLVDILQKCPLMTHLHPVLCNQVDLKIKTAKKNLNLVCSKVFTEDTM